MEIIENEQYIEDIETIALLDLPWDLFKLKNVIITGATGLLGSFLIDVLMFRNEKFDMQCSIYAIGRNENRLRERFSYYSTNPLFSYSQCDVSEKMIKNVDKVDFVLHLASNTHPVAYATDPIGTIVTNIIGLKNVLDFAVEHNAERCLFASSVEIYGENRGDVLLFDEDYCGYINCNTTRAGYPESKRCGESLCQAYIAQKGLDIVIPRIARVYGPTLLKTDTKAMSQFLWKAVRGEDIVLKSNGNQFYSYLYVADAVSGLLTVLLKGECGAVYNISDGRSNIKLKELAKTISEYVDKKVLFEIPDKIESVGYSTATVACMDNSRVTELGWKAYYSIDTGIKKTVDILRNVF